MPKVTVNNRPIGDLKATKGFITLERSWQAGDVVCLDLPMPVQRVYADPRVKANVGRVALQRGPVVYCLEGADNGDRVRSLILPREAQLTASFEKDLLGGVAVVRGQALAVSQEEDSDRRRARPVQFLAIPYSTWDNRAPGPMVVWLPETIDRAEMAGQFSAQAPGVRIDASFLWHLDSLLALNDGKLPRSSSDTTIPRMTWWDHKGTTEWVSYRFPRKRTFSSAEVYWFDDSGTGGCRVPASWRLLWRDGTGWKPVQLTGGSTFGIARNSFNKVTFEPVATREVRLEARLKPGFSGGILEFKLHGN
jgi:hypothetical protein